MSSYTEVPNEKQKERIQELSEKLEALLEKLDQLIRTEIPAFNRLLNENGVPRIVVGSALALPPE
jgi:hypothetical protein